MYKDYVLYPNSHPLSLLNHHRQMFDLFAWDYSFMLLQALTFLHSDHEPDCVLLQAVHHRAGSDARMGYTSTAAPAATGGLPQTLQGVPRVLPPVQTKSVGREEGVRDIRVVRLWKVCLLLPTPGRNQGAGHYHAAVFCPQGVAHRRHRSAGQRLWAHVPGPAQEAVQSAGPPQDGIQCGLCRVLQAGQRDGGTAVRFHGQQFCSGGIAGPVSASVEKVCQIQNNDSNNNRL